MRRRIKIRIMSRRKGKDGDYIEGTEDLKETRVGRTKVDKETQ